MSQAPQRWPEGARGAVSLTLDNLGEAAEQELGMPTPTRGHYSVTTALPIVLADLAEAGVRATFFVEGVNAQTYPQALRSIVDAGHECAYHAWRHEDSASGRSSCFKRRGWTTAPLPERTRAWIESCCCPSNGAT